MIVFLFLNLNKKFDKRFSLIITFSAGYFIVSYPSALLAPDNISQEALFQYAREAADFATKGQLPHLDFAVNHYGKPDVAMFDFTSMYAADHSARVVERHGHRLLQCLVGQSCHEYLLISQMICQPL